VNIHAQHLIFGLFPDRELALGAIARLEDLGYGRLDISVMMTDATRRSDFNSLAVVGPARGPFIGSAVAAISTEIIGTAAVSPFAGAPLQVVVGPLNSAFSDAATSDGNVVGALIALGVSRERAVWYARGLDRGGIVVGVSAHEFDEPRVRGVVHDEFFAFEDSSGSAVITGRM
jgi:hypothetical protein